jgi:hypothetical protein
MNESLSDISHLTYYYYPRKKRMSDWGLHLPPVRGDNSDDAKGKGKAFCGRVVCGPGWQLTAIFWVVLVGVTAFVALEIAIVSKGDQLEATSKATVSMHDETTKMKEDIGAALKKFRANFPSNQETVTTQQILDSIDKAHSTVAWIDQVRRGITPETLHGVVNNVNALVSNATMFLDMVTAIFVRKSSQSARSTENQMLHSASGLMEKGAELLGSISSAEFHDAFSTTHMAIQSFVKASKNVSPEKVSRIVDSAADILGAADSEHIVAVISELTKGASDVIKRFSDPAGAGLRLSLPIYSPVSLAGAVVAPAVAPISLAAPVKK